MSIIIAVIFIIYLVYQHQRVTKLELLIKERPASVSQPIKPVASTNAVPENVTSSPAVQMAPSPVVQVINTPPKVADEEASGRILGRLGIAAVVIGMGFFLKYAFDNNWVGPAGRVMTGILIGVIVIFIGQWLRKKYLGYSDLLIGGGLAILYLSIYASYGLYQLTDPMMAFLGMIVITAIGVGLSILNATLTLSFLALIGGFLAPFMIGQNALGPWVTFTYITILNAGILGILFYKKWTPLVLIGLIGTWMHFAVWYSTSYNSSLLVPTLLFLLIQFLIFNASSLIRIIIEKIKATEIDYFVLGATALSFAGICYQLLIPNYRSETAVGAVIIAGFYLVVALIAYKVNPEDRTVNIFLPGLSVSFLTIAVPIQFSGPWIAGWWFIETLVLYIVASKSSSRGFQVMGVVVYILGLCDLAWYMSTYSKPVGYAIFFNGPFMMLIMAAVVAYLIAFVYYRYGSISPDIQKRGIMVFVVIANVITLFALTSQVIEYYNLQYATDRYSSNYSTVRNMSNTTVSILWALYAAFLTVIGFAKRYVAVRRMGLVLFIITAFKVVVDVWNLGELYRIISFIAFGIIALTISFLYVKYKDRLKDIV
jgi:uncharacterized membrane protein